MPVSSLKLASAVIGVGGVTAGAGVGIYQLVKTSKENNKKVGQNKKIKDLLAEKQKNILGKENNDKKWKKNWEQFKKDYVAGKLNKKSWTFAETNTLSTVADAPINFKNKCESNKELDNSDDNKFIDEVLLYCTDNGESAT